MRQYRTTRKEIMKTICTAAIAMVVVGSLVQADDEAANRPIVRSSQYGVREKRSG